ncbi:hypothetical protein U0070_026853 [Myodes glareolus]|uniref:Tropomodulin n=1 Tax=Myodes glareolus TaxID=447135 RepID=A0AAW0K0U7_MYOGA
MALPFRKDLGEYKDLDEDELLGNLSETELKQLETVLDDLDPENALLPAGFRQKNQTSKSATGPFDRERLLSYLEKEALEHKDREDYVPYTGEKKGESGIICCHSAALGSFYGGYPQRKLFLDVHNQQPLKTHTVSLKDC